MKTKQMIKVNLTVAQKKALQPLFEQLGKCSVVVAQVFSDGMVVTVQHDNAAKSLCQVMGGSGENGSRTAKESMRRFEEMVSKCSN